MPRWIRFIGSQLALSLTLMYVIASWPLLVLAAPFLIDVLLPLFFGLIAVMAASYVFAIVVTLTGNGEPPTPFALVCAAIYLAVCPLLLLLAAVQAGVGLLRAPAVAALGAAALAMFLLVYGLLVLVAYLLAALYAPAAPRLPPVAGGVDRRFESCFRGVLIGMNALMNALFAAVLYGGLSPALPSGHWIVVAVVLFLAGYLTVVLSLSIPPPFVGPAIPGILSVAAVITFGLRRFLGGTSWLMPMSAPYHAAGWLLFYASWVGHFLSLAAPGVFAPAQWSIVRIFVSQSGMFQVGGGIVGNASPGGSVVAAFSFLPGGSANDVRALLYHLGHHLNLGAFGLFFQTIGTLNERGVGPIAGQGMLAYSVRIAESTQLPSRGRPEVSVWR